jgi:hypothetical protein
MQTKAGRRKISVKSKNVMAKVARKAKEKNDNTNYLLKCEIIQGIYWNCKKIKLNIKKQD